MKSLFLILICSAFSAVAGYYYGRASAPHAAPTTPAPTAAEPVAPESTASEPIEIAESPALSEPDAVVEAAPVGALTANATRAAQTIQTLTDTQGREIQAQVLAVTGDQVKIRRDDGLETSIPLSMLSPEDLAFCEYLREHAPASIKPQPDTAPNKAKSADEIDWDSIFGS